MAKNKIKTVTVGKREFQISLMTPFEAVRVRNLLMTASFKAARGAENSSSPEVKSEFEKLTPEEQTKLFISSVWMASVSAMKKEDYSDIQLQCLLKCSAVISGGGLIPVMSVTGRWADTELEEDPASVDNLIVEALTFNLASFFPASPTEAPNAG